MITVQEADQKIQASLKLFPPVKRKLLDSYGLILREDIVTDRDFPPADQSLMDGIAINFSPFVEGQRTFQIQGIQAAGLPVGKITIPNGCFEIMTGAVLPEGCDTVIPIEDVTIADQNAVISVKGVSKGQWIRKRASDSTKNTTVIKSGHVLDAVKIAAAASVGKSQVMVTPKLKIAIISTGDELVDVDQTVESYQIRKSNCYLIESALQKTQLFESRVFHFKDDFQLLLKAFRDILNEFDVLVLSGGVSMGKFDFIPKVMKELKVKEIFHKVQQKPGKPFWFGLTVDQKPIFALPGNPVATGVGTYRYVITHLRRALGHEVKHEFVTLNSSVTRLKDKVLFQPVVIMDLKENYSKVEPVHLNGSADLLALAQADGFVEISAGADSVKDDEVLKFYRF